MSKETFNRIIMLDTNVLLHDPNCFSRFEEDMVVLPVEVIEELDEFKRREDEIGRHARMVARKLDDLRQVGSLTEGVKGNGGPIIRVELEQEDMSHLPSGFSREKKDNWILATGLFLQNKYPDREVLFVSKDINLRIKGNAIGLKTQDYESGTPQLDDLFTGVRTIAAENEESFNLYKEGTLKFEVTDLFPNEFLVIQQVGDETRQALAMRDGNEPKIRPLRLHEKSVSGISARNKEQRFALELLLDDNIKLVTIIGGAGTGKTLLAIAAGLSKVMDDNKYARLTITRPIMPLGKDLGFLPGSMEEKMDPWMKPVMDSLDLIFANRDGTRGEHPFEMLQQQRLIEIEPVTYMRGRSLPKQFFLVDEAQNLTPHEAKTLLTRVGEGTKVVFTGDPTQIDHPYLDSRSNGLTHIVEKFKSSHLAGHITLVKGERSELAELAAKIL